MGNIVGRAEYEGRPNGGELRVFFICAPVSIFSESQKAEGKQRRDKIKRENRVHVTYKQFEVNIRM